jgi:ankyrin repeat protein
MANQCNISSVNNGEIETDSSDCDYSLAAAVVALVTKDYVKFSHILRHSFFHIDDEFDIEEETVSEDEEEVLPAMHRFVETNEKFCTSSAIACINKRTTEDLDFLEVSVGSESIRNGNGQARTYEYSSVQRSNRQHLLRDIRTVLKLDSITNYSLLQIACKLGDTNGMKIILSSRPSLNKISSSGESALHIACKYAHTECVRLLINSGANVSLRHVLICGDSPLLTTIASCDPMSDNAMAYIVIARMLIDAHCDVNMADDLGLAPIHIAAMKVNTCLLRLLIENGADVNSSSAFVEPPLLRAIAHKSTNNAVLLINAGCNVNAVVLPSNVTPLFAAIQNNLLAVVVELLSAGADPTYGPTESCPYHYAASNKRLLMLYLLLIYRNRVNCTNVFDGASLLVAVTRQMSLTGAKLLLSLGADPDLDTKLGTTAMFAAVKSRSLDIVKLLIRTNCNLETASIEYNIYKPMTATQLAIETHQWGIVKILLGAGAKLLWSGVNRQAVASSQPANRWLTWRLGNPWPLHHIAMVTVRRSLGRPLAEKLNLLNYPSSLKRYILTTVV